MTAYIYRSFDDLTSFHPGFFLPEKICRSFFIFLLAENKSPQTVYAYAQDISIFLKYLATDSLSKEIFTDPEQYTYDNLNRIEPDTISQYRGYVHAESIAHQDKVLRGGYVSKAARLDPTSHLDELEKIKRSARIVKDLKGKATTSNRKMASLRGYVNFLLNNKFINNNFLINVHNERIDDNQQIVYLKTDEITSLLGAVTDMQYKDEISPQQKGHLKKSECRDYAILMFFIATGLRVSELASIDVKDLDFKNNEVSVLRKGNEERRVPFTDAVKEAICAYIELERPQMDPSGSEPALFLSNRGTRITTRSLERLVSKYAKAAEIPKPVFPHTLRKTFGSNYYQSTNDIAETSKLLNHKSVALTAKVYSAIDEEAAFMRAKNITFIESPKNKNY